MPRVSVKPDGRQLPTATIRDLLAIARVLYRARSAEKAPEDVLQKLKNAGEALSLALEFSMLDPYALGHKAGWHWADTGIKLLSEVLYIQDASTLDLVHAAQAVLKRTPKP